MHILAFLGLTKEKIHAFVEIGFLKFLTVVMMDVKKSQVSGCSVDSSILV